MGKSYKMVLALLATIVSASQVEAATQGTLGATSTGSLTISVTKPARVKISGLTDLTLASWVDGDGAVTLTNDVCVYSTRPSGAYTVKATGSGTASAFTLSASAVTLPYTVTWNSGGVGALANTGTALTANVTSGTLNNAATDNSNCAGTTPGNTARIIVGITNANMQAISDGVYTGTLTLLVSPI
ncbi:MAG: hypothetical protein IPP74_10540 [Alphaproteobacteria bacterium]|nr:hypothetical protein [Alphaproteobacteria bacterium]